MIWVPRRYTEGRCLDGPQHITSSRAGTRALRVALGGTWLRQSPPQPRGKRRPTTSRSARRQRFPARATREYSPQRILFEERALVECVRWLVHCARADHGGRNALNYGMGLNILCHDRSRSDNRACPYRDTTQYHRARTDPSITVDHYRRNYLSKLRVVYVAAIHVTSHTPGEIHTFSPTSRPPVVESRHPVSICVPAPIETLAPLRRICRRQIRWPIRIVEWGPRYHPNTRRYQA